MTGPKNVPNQPDHLSTEPRSWLDSLPLRTLAQNIGVDVLIATSAVVVDATSSAADGVAWGALGLILVKTVLNTFASSVMRRVRPPEA